MLANDRQELVLNEFADGISRQAFLGTQIAFEVIIVRG
jgi:hypothetical protein